MKVNVYVDGFNLYYGVKRKCCKWLDLSAVCRRMMPSEQIQRMRYFTAAVKPTSDDPEKPNRQQVFIRALRTIPNLTIHYGHFRQDDVWMYLAEPPASGPSKVLVRKFEEKGSDVNLATWLLLDGFNRDYQLAIVVSNDSDLAEPIRVVRQHLGIEVGVWNPRSARPVSELRTAAAFCECIPKSLLRQSLFPDSMRDDWGEFCKPQEW